MSKALSHQVRPTRPAIVISDIIDRDPASLKPWPDNPRQHPDQQIAKIKSSIHKFGFTAPLIVDENSTVLSGHARLQASLELGLAWVPTRTVSGLSQSQKRAYVIADNKLAQLSSWDHGLLKSELTLLIQDDFELEATGFDTVEIDLLFDDGDPQTEALHEQDFKPHPVSRLGDLWFLGDHRLLCADARIAASYDTLLQGEVAQMSFTDPPYNVPILGHVCGKGRHKHREFAMAAGEMSSDEFTDFLRLILGHLANASTPGAINCICMDWRHLPELHTAALPIFGAPIQMCVWVKPNAGMGTFYRSQHELVCMFKHGSTPHINNFELGQHGRYRTNVWSYPGANSAAGRKLLALHPTVKPVAMVADALRDCSHRRGVVLDPFAGSGTILLAAERTGRHGRAMELDPAYVEVAIQRWQRLTGAEAVLAQTGQLWSAVERERRVNKPAGGA